MLFPSPSALRGPILLLQPVNTKMDGMKYAGQKLIKIDIKNNIFPIPPKNRVNIAKVKLPII